MSLLKIYANPKPLHIPGSPIPMRFPGQIETITRDPIMLAIIDQWYDKKLALMTSHQELLTPVQVIRAYIKEEL